MRSSPAERLQRLVEALDQRVGAELEQEVGWRAALEGLAVDLAGVVDQEEVAVAGGALDGLEAGQGLAHLLDLGIDRLRRNLGLGLADLEPPVLAELRRRADARPRS